MGTTRVVLVGAAIGAVIAAPAANAATVKVGAPNIASFRGKPVSVVFFHPF